MIIASNITEFFTVFPRCIFQIYVEYQGQKEA